MPILLHILTQTDDALAKDVIAKHQSKAENQIEVVDLTGLPEPDYKKLLEKIFEADSIQVW